MRKHINDFAIDIALAAASRSEDPWTQVGAVALTSDNRVIAVAYNGLLPGVSLSSLFDHLRPDGSQSDDDDKIRDLRLPYMVHAEQNLCSLIKRNEASWCAITHSPCQSCLVLLASHGIRRIIYRYRYGRDDMTFPIAKFYGIELQQV